MRGSYGAASCVRLYNVCIRAGAIVRVGGVYIARLATCQVCAQGKVKVNVNE